MALRPKQIGRIAELTELLAPRLSVPPLPDPAR